MRLKRLADHVDDGLRMGEQLRAVREERGLTRPQVAELSGISAETIVKIERGATLNPGVFTLEDVCAALGMTLAELLAAARQRPLPVTPPMHDAASGLVSVGYEARTAEELVSLLAGRAVSTLADVRLTPLSRKAGLSKTKLAARLQDAGITYWHLPQLGNPRENRAWFGTDTSARQRYRDRLVEPGAAHAVTELATRSRTERVAVLCFERAEEHCHRGVVLDTIRRTHGDVPIQRL